MSFDKLWKNAGLLAIAGSETTFTLPSGALFLPSAHADTLPKLKEEVWLMFRDKADIILSMPIKAPRLTPKAVSSLQEIPCLKKEIRTTVGVWHWATYRSTEQFTQAEELHLERFLGQEPRYADDRPDAVQPFPVGPRDCLGRN
ncbi:hypothetical protein BKA67DRAFT_660485 [Truncatella angustata]|uniref:Uncharacterized protein n=1 Tax=Truncatella angustata TaxID=152316 RepID=A0A9P8UGH1_9PEZI|nr:uncharacterized protein BKA67DRAFT_660485 [Truncatella angustata]KAH6651695.1 hypothetical protein BKA67DRAFT_660485 [Truncatella angustata]